MQGSRSQTHLWRRKWIWERDTRSSVSVFSIEPAPCLMQQDVSGVSSVCVRCVPRTHYKGLVDVDWSMETLKFERRLVELGADARVEEWIGCVLDGRR